MLAYYSAVSHTTITEIHWLIYHADNSEERFNAWDMLGWHDQILNARKSNKHRIEIGSPWEILSLFESFSASGRRCMEPVDYVYGVLGIFQFKIPRLKDPNEVWKLFLSELEKYLENMEDTQGRRFSLSPDAYCVKLQEAQDMSDVYQSFITFTSL